MHTSINLNEMSSYSGLHYIMSEQIFKPSTSTTSEAKYDEVDINLLYQEELDINNTIPRSIKEEIEEEYEPFGGFIKEKEFLTDSE